jgi:sterol desaturase/sphingolipid hydroxylase (fatty acid hydroxylase superfamily)
MSELSNWEPALRISIFAAVALLLLIAEATAPRRVRRAVRLMSTNIALFVTNTLFIRIISTTSLVGVGLVADSAGYGLLSLTGFAPWLEAVVAFLVLDGALYTQHRLMHRIPFLWRFHRIHHADPDFDVTTGVRFHPAEILVSFIVKAVVILAIGTGPLTVVVFEATLSSASLFTHANLKLSAHLDTYLRRFFVTPEMHRIHHSVKASEHNRNFCFFLSCWDLLFGSYCAESAAAQRTMAIGLKTISADEANSFRKMLIHPFQRI